MRPDTMLLSGGPHSLLPLTALLLNVSLAALALARNPRSRLTRAFATFVSAIALWNFGVFMLRQASTPEAAYHWEVVIHVGLVALPACYLHFVLIFLERTGRRRAWLVGTYAVAAFFMVANVTGHGFLVAGITSTAWGWAPAPGVLYAPFVLYLNAALLAALILLERAYRATASSFARNRISLMRLGTSVSLAGGVIDFARFILARAFPAADLLYPVGIPANMLFALLIGTAIVRYRMFNISVVVKRLLLYAGTWAAITVALASVTWAVRRWSALGDVGSLEAAAPLALVITLLVTPLGQRLETSIERLMFSRRRGCYQTLVQLSKGMTGILDSERLAETLVHGLVHGVPLSHCTLATRNEASKAFVVRREESVSGETSGVGSLDPDSRIVGWLTRHGTVLVKEEARLNPRLRRYFAADPTQLASINATLVVPLRVETELMGVLFIGEKLSGEVFTADELEVLSLLATQAAVSLENARLYEQAERERRRLEVLYRLSGRLAAVHETDRILPLIVHEAARLLTAELAALRLVEDGALVLKATTDSVVASALRARLGLGESLTGTVLTGTGPVAVEDVLTDERLDSEHKRVIDALGLHAYLGVPLRANGQAIGVLYVYSRARRRFLPEEVSLLSAFADQASLTIEKDRLFRERKKAEEALRQSEKLATMGQLLAGVAHELNNPLTVIVGYATLLRAQLADERLANAAREIDTAAGRCTRIVRNFLGLARKRPPERQRVGLNDIVADSLELVAYPLRVDGIEAVTDLAADLPVLWADPHQLQEVVVNLLTNAHHALREAPQPRRVTLSTRWDARRSRVVLRVADTGPGVRPELRARIFEPFFTTKAVGQGTGLGLSLCHGIVESHGGSITVEDQPGGGAVFCIELLPGPEATNGTEAAPSAAPALRSKSILVVDDEPAVARLLSDTLAVDEHVVDIVTEGAAALERLGRGRYDLVIADVRMPDIDGPMLYREADVRYPGTRPPFVFVTGDLLGPETTEFLEKTRSLCLSKPFELEDVRRTIATALGA